VFCLQSSIVALRNIETAPPALKLLRRYLTEAPAAFEKHGVSSKNDWVGRFKVIARIENIDVFNLPAFITAYNAKPVLIRTTGDLRQ
jgi:hypothetical protein